MKVPHGSGLGMGKVAKCDTRLSYWMIKNGLTTRRLARIVGCSEPTIKKLRHGGRVSRWVIRMLLALYPDCPRPNARRYKVHARPLPEPHRHSRPVAVPVSALSILAGKYLDQISKGKTSPDSQE